MNFVFLGTLRGVYILAVFNPGSVGCRLVFSGMCRESSSVSKTDLCVLQSDSSEGKGLCDL